MKCGWFEMLMAGILFCALIGGSIMFWSLWATAIESYVHNLPK